jgi:hypothetical protein
MFQRKLHLYFDGSLKYEGVKRHRKNLYLDVEEKLFLEVRGVMAV